MADISITSANVRFSNRARIVRGTAGAAVDIGDAVYNNGTKWVKAGAAIADIETNTAEGFFGLVASAAEADTQDVLVCVEDPDMTVGGTVTVGDALVVSANPGMIAPETDLVATNAVVYMVFPTSATNGILKPFSTGAEHA